jgi:hypothetical protein
MQNYSNYRKAKYFFGDMEEFLKVLLVVTLQTIIENIFRICVVVAGAVLLAIVIVKG